MQCIEFTILPNDPLPTFFENKFFENIVIGVLKSKLTGHGFEPRQLHTFRQERLTRRHSTVLRQALEDTINGNHSAAV